jgi:hypothetical protein
MAEILGKDVVLSVNLGTDAVPDWKIIGCAESDGFSGSTDSISISNKCVSGYTKNLPGDKSWSFANTAVMPKVPETGFISYDELFELWNNDSLDGDGELAQFKLENVPGADFDYYRKGRGFISDLGEQVDAGDVFRTDITITGNGAVTNVETT